MQPIIERTIKESARKADMLLISGGIGPTADDLTRQALAAVMGQPLVFQGTPTQDPGPPPLLGQHTDEVLREAGYDAAGIAALRAKKVVR